MQLKELRRHGTLGFELLGAALVKGYKQRNPVGRVLSLPRLKISVWRVRLRLTPKSYTATVRKSLYSRKPTAPLHLVDFSEVQPRHKNFNLGLRR